jgi:hypothetical protein
MTFDNKLLSGLLVLIAVVEAPTRYSDGGASTSIPTSPASPCQHILQRSRNVTRKFRWS